MSDDLKLVVQKLDNMDDVLKEHGQALKDLSRAFTAQAVQNEQIKTIIARVDAMWVQVDQVKSHQAQCPKPQIKQLWCALGIVAAVYATTLTVVISFIAK